MKQISYIILILFLLVPICAEGEMGEPFSGAPITFSQQSVFNTTPTNISGVTFSGNDEIMKAPPGGGSGSGTGNLGDEPVPLDDSRIAISILVLMAFAYAFILYKQRTRNQKNRA